MINQDTKEVFELSDYFHQLGNAIGEYVQNNKTVLKDEEKNSLIDKQIELLQLSGKINAIGVSAVLKDVQGSLEQMNTITNAVKKTLIKLTIVQDAIDLATALAAIGTAIVLQNPKMFISNIGKAGSVIGSVQNKGLLKS